MPKITSTTKLYALLGNPVEHSLSPLIQNAAFQSLALNCVYLAFCVKSKELMSIIDVFRKLRIPGFNVTIPHKVSIMKYLDKVESRASSIGAVNTVVNIKDKLIGYNTDGAGALVALKESCIDPFEKKVVILGAGGAARALSFYIAPLVKSLVLLNRTGSSAETLATNLCERFNVDSIFGRKLTKGVLLEELRDVDILINATSVGMYPKIDETLVDKTLLRQEMTVFDIVYNPFETRLLKDAKAAGAKIINGMKMLVYQGALAFEIWTGKKPPIDVMIKALAEALEGI